MAVILPFILSLVVSVPTIGVPGIVLAFVVTATIQVLLHPSRTAGAVERRIAGTWTAADEVIVAFFGHHASTIKRALTVITVGVVWYADAALVGLASMSIAGDQWNPAQPPQSYIVPFALTALGGLWMIGVVVVLRSLARRNEGRANLTS